MHRFAYLPYRARRAAGASLSSFPVFVVTVLSVSNVSVSFGATQLFKDITFTVDEGERWGIIGRNGAGKTSIFKIIIGELRPTTGSVARKPGLRHALLDQHRAFEGVTTVWEA